MHNFNYDEFDYYSDTDHSRSDDMDDPFRYDYYNSWKKRKSEEEATTFALTCLACVLLITATALFVNYKTGLFYEKSPDKTESVSRF